MLSEIVCPSLVCALPLKELFSLEFSVIQFLYQRIYDMGKCYAYCRVQIH